ncbi:fructose-1,6-bisphosphate aldolase/phosphatase [Thermus altitudinis]|uniref:fructose-1,6-bisphosphate aldolase/phosphatase n=1 Tax=Thermus altitudinis TaxID=2908145 RepID=UPI001FAA8238|nr:fructose-1,6-bisphosphate aldolase/phosphatase [Thermus altitudinis]
MKVTLSVLKADIGSIGGHTLPSRRVLAQVEGMVREAVGRLLLDAHVFHIGDDIVLLLSHAQGPRNPAVHELAWKAFREGTRVAKEEGLYGAGQDLLKDAFSGNLHGLGPQVAEMEFEERPAEPFMVLAADKTEPGAFNLPLYLAFADPMYSSGLLLSSELRPGFRFRIMDLAQTERDSYIVLDAPERLYDIAALLRDSHRFGIESIWSRRYGEIAAVVSTTRLRNIAGRYVGKDDPVAILRTQRIFPATEEFGPPFALAPFVAGDTRGSHHLPLMPVKANTPASTFFCVPMVCGLAFSLKEGRLSEPVDLFADPVWDAVRARVVAKAQEMRRQGFYGPAMLPMEELEYTGIAERLKELEREFS